MNTNYRSKSAVNLLGEEAHDKIIIFFKVVRGNYSAQTGF